MKQLKGTAGAVLIKISDIFVAPSPRGPRRVQILNVETDGARAPHVMARELGVTGTAAHPFLVQLTHAPTGWRMPPWYTPAPTCSSLLCSLDGHQNCWGGP